MIVEVKIRERILAINLLPGFSRFSPGLFASDFATVSSSAKDPGGDTEPAGLFF